MIEKININLNVLESMIYFWEASKDGEKVGEPYIMTIADDADMKSVYTDNFNAESVRRALSAISNREIFSGNKEERKFWNNNMWMMDDLEFMRSMIKPIKVLNLDEMTAKLQKVETNKDYNNIEVIFLPLHGDVYYIKDNKLIINFFKVMLDFMDFDIVTIEGKDFKEFIQEKLTEVLA